MKQLALVAQAAAIGIEASCFACLPGLGLICVVYVLDQRFAVFPRPTEADLARGERQSFPTSKNNGSNFKSLLASLVQQIQRVKVPS